MNDIIGFIIFLIGCSVISVLFYFLFSDKGEKSGQHSYQDMVKCEVKARKDFEGDFIE